MLGTRCYSHFSAEESAVRRGLVVGSVRPRAWALTPGSVACVGAASPPFISMIHRSPSAHEADSKHWHFYCLGTCSTAHLRPWRQNSLRCARVLETPAAGRAYPGVVLHHVCVYICMDIYIFTLAFPVAFCAMFTEIKIVIF